ncbi:hypothetical protein [Altibacter sp. HG106]|uniref:hypothetical protein n=1 Tax=Altibacter sp. HG106 TaxID=3023937 RepID=UPI00235044D2|nr:hypothetical protein [Altibacter sp. HG106]MDC7996383.1 hypothetical protein [Altibacter sp. HG106]
MDKTKIIGLSSFILSHLFLILGFVIDDAERNYFFLFEIAWVIGIISVVSNVLLADKIGIKGWLIGIFGVCGILWFFPPLLITYFGIPCMIIFLVIGVYIHGKIFAIEKEKTA